MPVKKASSKPQTINLIEGNETLMCIACVDSFRESEFIWSLMCFTLSLTVYVPLC